MKKAEFKEIYQMMLPEHPDIVTVKQLWELLGISRAVLPADRELYADLYR